MMFLVFVFLFFVCEEVIRRLPFYQTNGKVLLLLLATDLRFGKCLWIGFWNTLYTLNFPMPQCWLVESFLR